MKKNPVEKKYNLHNLHNSNQVFDKKSTVAYTKNIRNYKAIFIFKW